MYATFRLGRFSRQLRPRAQLAIAGLAVLLAAVFVASIATGSTTMPLARVVDALLGNGPRTDQLIIGQFRLPRTLQAAQAGICLAVAGVLLQRATRNPLASPGVLGVVDGAGLGAVLFLTAFGDGGGAPTVGAHWQPLAALLGGLALVAAVFLLARGQAAPVRLILFGMALAALAKAGITLLLVVGPIHRASQAMHWLAGAVNTATWAEVRMVAGPLVVLLCATAAMARRLDPLDLDDDTARAAGLPAPRVRLLAVVLAAALTAVSVAFVGGIGFVGLIAPHLARRIAGPGAGANLAAAALLGAVMVIGADLAVRIAFAPIEVPAGTVTALVGAPYMLLLLTRRMRSDG
ncbi:MAG TPA: iron ABC transporter permease [Azospirillaceae bacterium]|nr:iron ABC transporter permease [Azospirillaceae bacterium]